MKNLLILLSGFFGLSIFNGQAQPFNFKDTQYWLTASIDSSAGMFMANSGSTLGDFNFSAASSATHPLLTQGIYFPVTDCQGKNLWVRVRHVAADPNGTSNGWNVPSTLSSAFLIGPLAIGGWNGFLYLMEIHRDQNLTGTRANILAGLYPTGVTVESLETLCCPNSEKEFLSFIALNPESEGWTLNSINFTGQNPNSLPGFNRHPNYLNPQNLAAIPAGFSPDFPTGSDSIYAISLATSGYSEFRMSANQVSRFYYGYEYHTGGYQGMSMQFGLPPLVGDSTVNAHCYGDSSGSVYIKPSGVGPYTYSWASGQTSQNLINIPSGSYSVTVTDANGCVASTTKTVNQPSPFSADISFTQVNMDTVSITASVTQGGVPPFHYLWNNGDTTAASGTKMNGTFTVRVADANGCYSRDTIVINTITGIASSLIQAGFEVFPVPFSDRLHLEAEDQVLKANSVLLTSMAGKTYPLHSLPSANQPAFDTRSIPAGFYVLSVLQKGKMARIKVIKAK